MMTTLLKLGLSGYDVKPRFGAFQCEYLLQNTLFFLRKNLVVLDTHTKKMKPLSIILGGGVHGKSCWLIAYVVTFYFALVKPHFYVEQECSRYR